MPKKESVRPDQARRLKGIRDSNIAWENIRTLLLEAPTNSPDKTEKELRTEIKKTVAELGGTLHSLWFECYNISNDKAVLRACVSFSFFGCYRSGWPMDSWDRDRKAGIKLTQR